MTVGDGQPALVGSPIPRVSTVTPEWSEDAELVIDRVNQRAEQYLGVTLDSWQRLWLRHLVTRDSNGRVPTLAGLLVARQNGKTTVMQAYCLDRLLEGDRIISCAQNLDTATRTWEQVAELFDTARDDQAPLGHLTKRIVYSASRIELSLTNGGAWFVRASNRKASRGMAKINLTWYDEAAELTDWSAYDAIAPTMSTATDPQSVFTGTAGTRSAEVLNSLQQRGRQAVTRGDDPIVWLEWSADPQRDMDDKAGWAEANPQLGKIIPWTLLEDEYRTYLAADKMDGWRTERLCQPIGAFNAALDINDFRRLEDTSNPPKPGDKGLVMSFTIDLNRRGAATLIGRQLEDGRTQLGVLSHWEAQPGEEVSDRDVADQIVAEYLQWKPAHIAYNSFVAAGVAHLLTRRRLPLVDYKGRRYFDSCQMFAELIRTGMLAHDGDPVLASHVSIAVREELRNGEGWFLSRRLSPGPIYTADGMAMLSHATSKRRATKSSVVTLAG